jgi:two-component system LytT family sensor kinase
MLFDSVELTLTLLQQTCVYLVIAYLLSRARIFIPLTHVAIRLPHRVTCYLVFSAFCIMGTYLGLKIDDSIANTRAIGAVLGGVLGGPGVGLAVGFTGGLHRYTLGGISAFACMISTMVEGLVGGLFHYYMMRRGKVGELFNPLLVALVTLAAEVMQMLILLALVQPWPAAQHLVRQIAAPMWIANSLGAGFFIRILLDRRVIYEQGSSVFSTKALAIATRVEGLLHAGFDADSTAAVARIVYEETGVGAVAITDTRNLLAFIGIGDDHHLPGTPISSALTRRAIDNNEVVYADGNEIAYRCSLHPRCPLAASLLIPLVGEDKQVIGTIKLYEPRSRLFSNINLTLGKGIAQLLSTQILAGRYMEQRDLLAQSEIRLLHAQINPHFLFNALNTISAVIRRDHERACNLVLNLSTYFRKNLKRPSDDADLDEELKHVAAYLEIEQARFLDRLVVEFDIPDTLKGVHMPAFSLQPIVENAIKHGTSQLLNVGRIRISAAARNGELHLTVEDNAGLFDPSPGDGARPGLGLNLVRRRIENRYGPPYGLEIACEPETATRVTLRLPLSTAAATRRTGMERAARN